MRVTIVRNLLLMRVTIVRNLLLMRVTIVRNLLLMRVTIAMMTLSAKKKPDDNDNNDDSDKWDDDSGYSNCSCRCSSIYSFSYCRCDQLNSPSCNNFTATTEKYYIITSGKSCLTISAFLRNTSSCELQPVKLHLCRSTSNLTHNIQVIIVLCHSFVTVSTTKTE